MHLTAQIKLLPTPEQAVALSATLRRCNEACNWLSAQAFETQTFRQFDLHRLGYRETRERFGLASQVAVRCISKVADAYKAGKDGKRAFRANAAQPFDERIFRFCAGGVSIWTLNGRAKMPFACGEQQRQFLALAKGEVDLIERDGVFYLAVGCEVLPADPIVAKDAIGVDLGIVNIATDSDGKAYTGEAVERIRVRMTRRRTGLQGCGTKAAKRRLRKLSGRQQRFQRHTNHCISKAIVTEAQRSGRAIVLEDLKGIRAKPVKARRSQRARLHNWTFGQLRSFIDYKAELAGVPVLFVDPAHTSQSCPACGVIDKRNRRSQSRFSCVECGHAGPADHIAARNIRARAAVARPDVLAVA